MWRRILMAGTTAFLIMPVCAQVTKQFSVDDKEEIEKVNFSFKVNGGYYVLKSGGQQNDLISIYTNENLDSYSHEYNKAIVDKVCNVSLALHESGGESLSQKISYSMFGGRQKASDKIWKVLLEPTKPYRLNLNYGMGAANIDLSGLTIENLKVYSGNADVKIDYDPKTCNTVEMDTFSVRVDLGSVVVKRINLYRSNLVLADVGFGNMYLDFADKPTMPSTIRGSVGAGNLLIQLPDEDIPVKITVNESWLCKVRLLENFEKIDDHTYVNKAFQNGGSNPLNFELDVSMGSIEFKTRD